MRQIYTNNEIEDQSVNGFSHSLFLENTNKRLEELDSTSIEDPISSEVTGMQLLTEAPEKMDWLIENLLPKTGMAALAGGSDVGKSSILRQLGIAICCGDSHYLGFGLNPVHRSAIIACTEDDRSAVAFLLRKQVGEVDPSKVKHLRFVFDFENLLMDLYEMLINKPADIVIIDCFADAYAGDLKDTQKIRLFLSDYQRLSLKHSCFILFLHHTGKRTENLEPSKNNLLSGQGFESKMRLVMELRADPMNYNHRHLCIVKGNYLPANMKKESYVLEFNERSFTFSFTGERTPFEFLVKQNEDPGKGKYEQAKELKERGYTHDQIAQQLGYESKGTISKLLTKGEQKGW